MSELDEWTTDQVIRPLNEFWKAKGEGALDVAGLSRTTSLIRKAIREKVLESYHNGQNARPRGFQRPMRART
ncbi:MAG TPA: hypothetical protein VFQ47_08215 [Nitrososphaera sp.]|nr:hypothetical protein [Nitrososphaera sp.]